MRKRSLEVVKRDDLLRCLFLGARPIPKTVEDSELARPIVDQANFIDLAKGPEKEPFRKMYLEWLKRRTNPTAIELGITAALYASIPEAVPFARELIANPKQSPEILGQAILVLGNHGAVQDVLLLDKFRADERPYYFYKAPGVGTFTIQLREVATAMALLLRKEDFKKYGFEGVQVFVYWVGDKPAPYQKNHWFMTAAHRDAALVKAGKWLDEQPKPEVTPKK